ncbi:hypothetical protein M2405_004112 [Rhodococcus erythropolis]|nr:hypothetical protein [Rhodococcus erythropolis]MCS4255809.1 hypothetical protein [Rhodococcus erythropolis]MCW2425326.1 hypothetical protein [Rhodococcus erythropolis]
MSGDEGSLFDELGIPRESLLPEPPEDVWSAALVHALDPDSAPTDGTLVPSMDDTVRPGNDVDYIGTFDDHDTVSSDSGDAHPDLEHFGDVDGPDDSDDEDINDDIDLGDGV